MEILVNPAPSSDLPRGGVVTIGNFDGVHRGHQMLVAGAVERARELAVPAVALTFEPHPEKVLRPESGIRLVTTRAQKAQLLERLGVDTLVELGFDRRFAATTAAEFARELLFRRLAPAEVRLGTNFRFGAGRQGDVPFLTATGRELGFAVVGVEPLFEGGEVISSTRLRREIAHGHAEEVWRLMGRPYHVDGAVYRGERMGRKLGFPTINVEVENELLPAHGVYVTAVHIPSFSRVFPSVTNIGVRPTVYENYHVTVESHVLDFTGDVYREPVRLYFLKRLRDEMVFASSVELVAQIRRDVEATRAYFAAGGHVLFELVRQ
ncbi:MAG TPA: bifunctional riboflavin kinase/FAD synthetase [Thermoanaerobaculaceae bacterium]|nr:bifunctional riboflavin kinase/FAD synthetase [Thermoanaerobaculaceae bacterium]